MIPRWGSEVWSWVEERSRGWPSPGPSSKRHRSSCWTRWDGKKEQRHLKQFYWSVLGNIAQQYFPICISVFMSQLLLSLYLNERAFLFHIILHWMAAPVLTNAVFLCRRHRHSTQKQNATSRRHWLKSVPIVQQLLSLTGKKIHVAYCFLCFYYLCVEKKLNQFYVMFIYNRLSTIIGADQILVISDGRIAERGG